MECKYSLQYSVIFTHIFHNIDIRLVQELKSRCSEYTKEALHKEFEFPTLYQQLRIAIGAEGSQRSHITLRAQPHAYGRSHGMTLLKCLSQKTGAMSRG